MKRTMFGVFDRMADAQGAAERLARLGIARERIHLRTAGAASEEAASGEVLATVRSLFAEIFGPDLSADDARRFPEEIQDGDTVVAVEVETERELATVRQSLHDGGAKRVLGAEPAAKAIDDESDQDQSPETLHCIEICRACHKTCLQEAMTRCLEAGGKHVEPEHFRLLLNCAEICHTATNFMISRSRLHPLICGACAEVCAACGASCEELGGMERCVNACRECEESCRQVAGASA